MTVRKDLQIESNKSALQNVSEMNSPQTSEGEMAVKMEVDEDDSPLAGSRCERATSSGGNEQTNIPTQSPLYQPNNPGLTQNLECGTWSVEYVQKNEVSSIRNTLRPVYAPLTMNEKYEIFKFKNKNSEMPFNVLSDLFSKKFQAGSILKYT